MIRRAAPALLALMLATAAAAAAKATLQVHADDVRFYATALGIVARGNVRVDVAALGYGGADAAYVDLRRNRLLLAGHAHLGRASGDALAVDLDRAHVDTLDVDDGATAGDFDFPDLDPRDVFIRSTSATIVAHANARFTPATFPSSVGAFPVPTYLYTFADNTGFAEQSLPGATFDQPYGLFGSPSDLVAAHVRYVQGTGLDFALDQHLVDGNRSYLVTGLDDPLGDLRSFDINGYRRLGPRYTTSLSGTVADQTFSLASTQTGAFGVFGARIDSTLYSGGGATSDLTMRTPDYPLVGGLTFRLQSDYGLLYQRGGVMPVLPNAAAYTMLFHHGVDGFFATPQFHGPLRTSIGGTFEVEHTWYAFPRAEDTYTATATAARRLGPLTLTGIYTQSGDLEEYGKLQGLFFPSITTFVAPDGTPYPGYAAYSGASTSRLAELGVQLVTSPTTTYRLTYAHTDDFPQFHGYGAPIDEITLDVRFRLARNIGIDVGRSDEFAWGGVRWVPAWEFAILP